jgi:hypothetical protein
VSDPGDASQTLADELEVIVRAVPGVLRVHDRPGVARLARRVVASLPFGPGGGQSGAISVALGDNATELELDVVVEAGYEAPEVARQVAAVVLARLDLADLPPARVDVRVVAFG